MDARNGTGKGTHGGSLRLYRRREPAMEVTMEATTEETTTQGFGIVIPEAMLAAKPIIASNAGALPELIEHGKTGLIVDPYSPQEWADAIIKLKQNKQLSNSLSFNAKTKAEHIFTIENYVKNYEILYNELISAR